VLGVSPDDAESHRKFKAKYGLNLRLLVDSNHAIARAYGVWVQKNTFGVKRMGIARTTFVIDTASRVARIFEKVNPAGHAGDVADALAGLQAGG
jgi:peroxiredoxin Q/BCP